MLDRAVVFRDVALAVQEEVTNSVGRYSPSLIPKKKPPIGFQANSHSWGAILHHIRENIVCRNQKYCVLIVDVPLIGKTLSQTLAETADLITDRIVAADSQKPED